VIVETNNSTCYYGITPFDTTEGFSNIFVFDGSNNNSPSEYYVASTYFAQQDNCSATSTADAFVLSLANDICYGNRMYYAFT
jgi:hypothetical protein